MFHARMLRGVALSRPCAGNSRYPELLSAPTLSCPEDTASLGSSPASGSLHLSTPSFEIVLSLVARESDVDSPCVIQHPTDNDFVFTLFNKRPPEAMLLQNHFPISDRTFRPTNGTQLLICLNPFSFSQQGLQAQTPSFLY